MGRGFFLPAPGGAATRREGPPIRSPRLKAGGEVSRAALLLEGLRTRTGQPSFGGPSDGFVSGSRLRLLIQLTMSPSMIER